jgi:hypothetical protein
VLATRLVQVVGLYRARTRMSRLVQVWSALCTLPLECERERPPGGRKWPQTRTDDGPRLHPPNSRRPALRPWPAPRALPATEPPPPSPRTRCSVRAGTLEARTTRAGGSSQIRRRVSEPMLIQQAGVACVQ